jgi:hypothetical protein
MKRFETFKTDLGRELEISSNKSKRHFTIKTEIATYRTFGMSKADFDSAENNTGQDWAHFLKTNEYYILKK